MRTFGILVLIGVLGMPLVATAQESAQQPSQRLTWSMAEASPTIGVVVQQTSQGQRTRSMKRTWGGIGLATVGVLTFPYCPSGKICPIGPQHWLWAGASATAIVEVDPEIWTAA